MRRSGATCLAQPPLLLRPRGEGGAGDTPTRSTPWVNLAGGDGGDHFYAGGRIDDGGVDIACVQLRFADERSLEDDSDEGIPSITDDAVSLPAIWSRGSTTPAMRSPPGPLETDRQC